MIQEQDTRLSLMSYVAKDGIDYICITDIARQKNVAEQRMLLRTGCVRRTPWNTWVVGETS